LLNADLADQFVELHSMPSPLWQKVIVNWQSVTLAVARWRYLVKVTSVLKTAPVSDLAVTNLWI